MTPITPARLCSASHFLPVNRATSRFLCAESTSPPYLMFRPPSALVAHFQLLWDSRDPMDLRTRIALLLLDLGLVLVLAALAIRAAT